MRGDVLVTPEECLRSILNYLRDAEALASWGRFPEIEDNIREARFEVGERLELLELDDG